ncbi:HAMP domain-containing sensor histidine kinase [Paenibacillus sp. J22TS3]|uniref:sensor histidine kinase n=1 Tax=Paenibacillus sp. J22TS3 TaxID=2807192 RepID=UPI001B05CDE5|nr:sensor histidine kinase [Paenibacillus sp. J22TS3]GIP20732.1 sensor histidine kinase [Paenibacillus sp. J22TS3]
MRLFLREHIPLFMFWIVQQILVLLVYWYDGYDHPLTALYASFLSLVMFLVYLIYRYYTHRQLYTRLSHTPANLKDSIYQGEPAPLPSAISRLLDIQFRHYQEQLKKYERQRQEHLVFMNQWVHQMKTPLSVIDLITQGEDEPQYENISEEADRMRQGLEMVLYMARLETFEQDFHVDRTPLRSLVQEVIHENKRYFIRSQVYPDNQVNDQFHVTTDAKWLRFILQQLLTNAIKYSSGTRSTIRFSAHTRDEALVLELRDAGIGIPKSDISRVFRPFFTGENGRTYKESTGMGLYLVKEVLDRLGHDIELESEVNQGTTVRIIFPYS